MRPVRMSRGCFVRQYFRGSNPGEEQRAIGNSGRKKPVGTISINGGDNEKESAATK